jgi:hypothetical protein
MAASGVPELYPLPDRRVLQLRRAARVAFFQSSYPDFLYILLEDKIVVQNEIAAEEKMCVTKQSHSTNIKSNFHAKARLASIMLRRNVLRKGRPTRRTAGTIACVCLLLGFACVAYAQTVSQNPNPTQEGKAMTFHASGPFEVKMIPQKTDNKEAESANIGRMSGDKQFHGDLEATGKGEMLSVQTAVEGSAAYVALELVNGKLKGRSGTFVLQHSATMGHGGYHQSITVVPDSGTGQLVGIAGKMTIIITDGKHAYEFDYTLPETP